MPVGGFIHNVARKQGQHLHDLTKNPSLQQPWAFQACGSEMGQISALQLEMDLGRAVTFELERRRLWARLTG